MTTATATGTPTDRSANIKRRPGLLAGAFFVNPLLGHCLSEVS
jgi:hypothetical protein